MVHGALRTQGWPRPEDRVADSAEGRGAGESDGLHRRWSAPDQSLVTLGFAVVITLYPQGEEHVIVALHRLAVRTTWLSTLR